MDSHSLPASRQPFFLSFFSVRRFEDRPGRARGAVAAGRRRTASWKGLCYIVHNIAMIRQGRVRSVNNHHHHHHYHIIAVTTQNRRRALARK